MNQSAAERVHNFSPGPATLPLSVLEEIQRDLLAYPGAGASILEISHRSPTMDDILEETELRLRRLLSIPGGYRVLFMQGGARLQFSMVPLNLLRGKAAPALYVVTGSWGSKAVDEARRPVVRGIPLVHPRQDSFLLKQYELRTFGDDVQFRVGDQHGNLEHPFLFRVEA